ncbi:DoxX family membrane protein [Actinoplanes sp. NPDC051851]|uniref:DoxX family membrane protein n=1 Tax=Actinoplanes sp. NPDC051851 TaxID=3154753 RepID=UPI00344A4BDF
MKPVRTAARAMLASIFVVSGVKVLISPGEGRIAAARKVTDHVTPLLERADPRLPTDPATLVRLKAAADVLAGLALATGRFSRPAAAVLAAGLVPTTIVGHPFWAAPPDQRANQQNHFLKNLGLLGGLLLAAADTEGRPGLRYRASHAVSAQQRSLTDAVDRSQRSVKDAVDRSQRSVLGAVGRSQRSVRRAVRTARREARIAARAASAARKLPV